MSRVFLLKLAAPLSSMPLLLRLEPCRFSSAGLPPARRSGPFRLSPYKKRHRDRVGEAHSLKPEDKNPSPKYKRISKGMRDFPLRKHSRFTHQDDLANWAMAQDEDEEEEADINFLEDVMHSNRLGREASSGVATLSEDSEVIPTATPKTSADTALATAIVTAPPEQTSTADADEEEWPEPTVTLKDIPKGMRHMLVYKGMRQPVAVIIGKKGVDRGLLNCVKLHFRTHEVLRVRVSKMWKDCIDVMAAELEKKSGAVIIERHGCRIILFRGYTHADIPRRTPPADNYSKSWWTS